MHQNVSLRTIHEVAGESHRASLAEDLFASKWIPVLFIGVLSCQGFILESAVESPVRNACSLVGRKWLVQVVPGQFGFLPAGMSHA